LLSQADLKRAINAGYAIGPRIETAGQVIVPPGGHANREANGPAEFAKAVREQIENGASWIKISISGGIADAHGDIAASPMMLDELKTVIEVAHRNGAKVTAHNGSPTAAADAIAVGIDCFEHGYYLDRKQLQAMKDKSIWLCPTIGVSQASVMEFFKRQGMPEWYMERVRSVSKAHWAMLQEAIRLGVNIAMGTDQNPAEPNAGTTATIRELEMYVEAGMTPLSSLRTATSAAAEMLGLTADVGSLSAGRFADIVAVKQNPLENIAALRTINFVMKGGQIARQG
jgi:imidazolonepropionase-like amidohydrolase